MIRFNRKGFTLVELSIVLVIIGLLIGGILIGQSLVDSVRVNSFVQQMQQIQIAMEQFKSKYKYLPGDSPLHSPAGDGDGIVETTSMNSGAADWTNSPYSYEVLYVWPHLWQDGFLQNDYPEFVSSSSGSAGTSVSLGHYPAVAFGEAAQPAGATIWTSRNAGLYIRAVSYSQWYTQIQSWTHKNCVYTVGEALAIDTKIDGGLDFGTGEVLAEEHCTTYPGGVRSDTTNGGCYDGNGYLIDNDDGEKRCYLRVRLFDWNKDVGSIQ